MGWEKKLSAVRKGKPPIKAIESWKGRKHTEETKAKLSAARKGKKLSPEICKRISKGHKGHSVSQEQREKISKANSKRVRCIETGEVFKSIRAAAKFYNISFANIIGVCRGYRYTAGGLHWEYYND